MPRGSVQQTHTLNTAFSRRFHECAHGDIYIFKNYIHFTLLRLLLFSVGSGILLGFFRCVILVSSV